MRYFLIVIFIFILVIFYKGLKKDPTVIPSNLLSKEIPEFSISSFSGSTLKTKDLRDNKVKIVNFFASWCPPCKIEHNQLLELSKKIPVYGIAKKNTHDDLSKWFENNGNPYTRVGMDTNGEASIEWGVYGLPETFIIDKGGIVKYKHVGPLMKRDQEHIEKIIKKLQ